MEQLTEEQLRSGTYSLLAALLRSTPDEALIGRLQGIDIDVDQQAETMDAMANAWSGLKQAAQQVDLTALDDEYHTLFIGLGRGELVPYGSWYLTGFLMEKPLGDLRRDLAQIGYERQENVREPEDHVAALCEVMALLITDDEIPLGLQRKFFADHIAKWIETFFMDLEKAKAAQFYKAVGPVGYEFIRLEKQYLSMLV